MIREYQTIAEENIRQAWETHQRVMFQLPTGGGKTVCVTNLIKRILADDKRILFIAHREELIKQAFDTFYKNNIINGIIKSGIQPNYQLPCQIGSVQTMIRRKELPKADYVFIDEAHHCLEDNSYGKIIQSHFPEAKVLGVTATPYRLGGKGFTKIFDTLIESISLADLIEMGFLVPLRYYASSIPDMSHVKVTAGDYDEIQSAKVMELAPIVESYQEHCAGKCGLVFAVTIEHSKKIVQKYYEAGIKAEHVDANTELDVRRGIFARLRSRAIQIVVNVGIATEGVDIPNIDFVQLARPTKSLSLFFQMIGRGTRADNEIIKEAGSDEHRRLLISASQKPHCIILDNAGLWAEHGLPDQAINWQRHFQGYKKKKKSEEEIEIIEFVAEDEDGTIKRSKIPKEIEGLKLIEITRREREKIVNLTSLKEFDRLFEMFKRLPQINKPGYKSFFGYREYCRRNSILMTDDIWQYMTIRLSTKEREDAINAEVKTKLDRIELKYSADKNDYTFLIGKVKEHQARSLNEVRRFGVPAWFLKKQKEEYEQKQLQAV